MRSSRELSRRVDLHAHERPNAARRASWWLAFWAGSASLMWVCLLFARGDNRPYQAGPVTTPHRLIENDCAKCHTTWTPLERLVGLRDDVHSTDNHKCDACHRVAEHHANQVPAHKDISCAACHQEHEGSEMLIRPSNRHCIACHTDLKTTHGPSETFAKRATRFDEPDGHPEFAFKRFCDACDEISSCIDAIGPKHPARSVMQFMQRPGDEKPHWQDRGRVRFNHAAHLKAEYDKDGKPVYGLIGKDRKFVDYSRSCEACHEPDNDRHFMKPIHFERHCQECHPLLFDNDRFPGQSVPHETPDVVRGFLTEMYTMRTLRGELLPQPATDQPNQLALRPVPGHRDFGKLTKDQAKIVLDDVAAAEELAQQHKHSLFGYEASGGCRYCHQLEPLVEKAPTSLANWRVVPPNIPERWLLDATFHHGSHRMLDCTACHADAGKSKSTGDVLIPSIAVCRTCHSESPGQGAGAVAGQIADGQGQRAEGQGSLRELLSRTMQGARFDCVECHRYHDPKKERLNGLLK